MIKPSEKNADAKIFSKTEGLELVIVKKDKKIIYLVFEDKKPVDIEIENEGELPVGTRCVGKVDSISKNINSAYITLPDKSRAFLKNISSDLKCEQNVAVEITRAASKGKLPSVSLVDEDISHRSDLSYIRYGQRVFEKLILKYSFNKILTDSDEIYKEILTFCETQNVLDLSRIHRYNDSMVSLSVLYSVTRHLEEATSRLVWLKSGANILIEETNAFTVIDVNSAKNEKGAKSSYLEINKEAACEIFRQMNLRNISGIILIDFINLKPDESKELLSELKELSKTQKNFTKVVDITPLGIAEITRKKEGCTLSDIYN